MTLYIYITICLIVISVIYMKLSETIFCIIPNKKAYNVKINML